MLLSKSEYQHVIDLLSGKVTADPVLSEMKQFFRQQFDCELFDLIADRISDGKFRLRFIVWDRDDKEYFFAHSENSYGRDEEKENLIKEKFSRLCRKYGQFEDFHDPDNYFAVADTIADEIRTDVQRKAEPQIRKYLDTVVQVRRYEFYFDTVHIFYDTDNDISAHLKDGLSDKIEKMILELKNPFDVFSALTNAGVFFSSLQTLKEKYAGNLFYYFK